MSQEIIGYDNDFLYLNCGSRIGNQVGANYIASKKAYRLPISVYALNELRDAGFDMSKVRALHQELKDRNTMLKNIKEQNDTEGIKTLRPYQRVDVEFINSKQHAAVFNEQRTGKTPTILTAVKDKLGKGLIVCPSGLKLNWALEYDKWIGKGNALVINHSPKKRKEIYKKYGNNEIPMLIISYETLRVDYEFILDSVKEIDVLIVDEAHRLRNHKTKQSIALYKLSKIIKHMYPMTGTPAVNHPSDVYGIFRLIYPNRFKSYWNFIERYFGYTEGRFGRELLGLRHDRKREFQELLEVSSIQRKRKEVMSWIPKVTERNIYLPIDKKQQKHYNKILEEFMYGDNVIQNVITQLMRLRQVCDDPGLLMLDGKSPKTEFLKQYVEDNDEKIIVFSMFTSYLNKLKNIFPDAVMLTGEQTQEQKQHAVDQIQHGDAKIILSNIIAGGTGWTLDQADTIIFLDKSYNPVDNEQAADRFIPTDPGKEYGAKQIINLRIENSIENVIEKMLLNKINIIKFVNNYGANALVNYGKGENNNNAGLSNL